MNEILNIQLNIQLNSFGVDEFEKSNWFHVQHFLIGFLTVGTSLCFKASWKGKVEIVKNVRRHMEIGKYRVTQHKVEFLRILLNYA